MFGEKKVIILSLVDKTNKSYKGLTRRILHHQEKVAKLINESICVVGRKTQKLTGWKGKGLWVLTKKKKWNRNKVNVTHSIDDLRLHAEGDTIYVLGGLTVAKQFEPYVDEFMIWTVNDSSGNEEWIRMQAHQFKTADYSNESAWSFVHYKRKQSNEISD